MLYLSRLAVTEREPARTHAREHRAVSRRRAIATAASAPAAPLQRRLAVGETLGDRYRVVGFLGRGAMGTVYRVLDRALDEEVALKMVDFNCQGLCEEVKLAQQVTHRNVCRTYDLEDIDGEHFVKMEYIAGETLADHLVRKGTLPIGRVTAIARAIADGLAAAHARGIVHRDLKPGNVMLARDRVALVDFGLATHEGASDVAGTPGYMSPEQLAGETIDARCDLFALGCVIFEMLAGAPPFGLGTIDEVAERQRAPLPDIRAHRRDVPRRLAMAITALLATDPADRTGGLCLFEHSRMPRAAVAGTIVVLALVAAGVKWTMARPGLVWEPRIVDRTAYEENADDPSLSPDGASLVFSSDRGHRDSWSVYVESNDSNQPRQISPPRQSCLAARWTRDASAILMSCDVGGQRRIVRQAIAGGPNSDLGPGWAVDDCGDELAVVVSRPTGAALVLRARDGHDQQLAALPTISGARCDRDGQRIVILEGPIGHPGAGGELAIVDRRGGVHRLPGAHHVESATFTADGAGVVFAMQRGESSSLYEMSAAGGPIRELTPHEDSAAAPDIARDGTLLVFDRDRTSSPLFELTAAGPVQRTFRYERLSHVVDVPGGTVLVATRFEQHEPSMVVIDLHDFSERVLARGEALFVGRRGEVVFRAEHDPRRLQTIALGGGAVATVGILPAPILDAAEGPDGIHVELDRDGHSEAWLVDRAGGATFEGVSGLVVPAPSGGWRLVRTTIGAAVTLRFVPPARPLTEPAFERAAVWGPAAWVNERELAFCDRSLCRHLDVTTGRDTSRARIASRFDRPITVTSGGERWFTTSNIGHVTRHTIANFGDRPWAH